MARKKKQNKEIQDAKSELKATLKERRFDIFSRVLLILSITIFLIFRFVTPKFDVDGISMQPTLYNSDVILTMNTQDVKRNDIVVFDSQKMTHNPEERLAIKRVIGISGDKIKIVDGVTYLNGEILKEDYISAINVGDNVEEFVLPNGYLYLMGDNRLNSLDSRTYGMIPQSLVKSKLLYNIYNKERLNNWFFNLENKLPFKKKTT